ncbi:MAG: AgmX/PglI C-terminal domain-containing protein [Myxococcota bacterium]|nr:AgmX/PglI C-terminal domain-containing protein [Myxococcota bacterium]
MIALTISGCLRPQRLTGRARTLPEMSWLPTQRIDRYEETVPPLDALSSEALARAVMTVIPEEKRHLFQHSPKLDLIAGAQAQVYLTTGQRIHHDLRKRLMWRYGIYHLGVRSSFSTMGQSHRHTMKLPGGDLEVEGGLAKFFLKKVVELSRKDGPHRFGVAYLHGYGYRGNQSVICLVSTDTPVTIERFTRRVKRGAEVEIVGQLAEGFERPILSHHSDDMGADRVKLTLDASRRFHAKFTAPNQPGEYFIELDAREKTGWLVDVSMIPFYVDMDPPTQVPALPPPLSKETMDAEQLRNALIEYVNSQRERVGLDPLRYYAEASAVTARFAKRAVAYKNNFSKAFRSELRRQGVRFKDLWFTLPRFTQMREWIRKSALSPNTRYRLLSPKYTAISVAHQPLGAPNNRILQLLVLFEEETETDSPAPPASTQDLTPAAIRRVIMSRSNAYQECYGQQLKMYSGLQGDVRVKIVISGEGRVSALDIASTTLKNEQAERCLLQAIKPLRFPAPKNGEAIKIRFPFRFRPDSKGEDGAPIPKLISRPPSSPTAAPPSEEQ